jgi:uncharacterized protein YegL
MNGTMPSGVTKMTSAKRALVRVLESLPESTNVGILAFGSVGSAAWLKALGPLGDRALIEARVRELEASGGTPLGECIKLGADALLEQRERQFGYGSYSLLIVTDGEANDPYHVENYAPDIVSRGIRMDVIGVAMNQDHTLARVAHSYRRANDAKALERAVGQVFAEVTAVSTDAAPGEGAFDLVAAFDAEVALEVIGALAQSGNHPIGEEPPRPEALDDDTSYVDFDDYGVPTDSPEDDDESGFSFFRVFIFAAIALWVIGRIKSAVSKNEA